MPPYTFDQLANRKVDHSKKWCQKFLTNKLGDLPDEVISMWIADMDFKIAPPIFDTMQEILSRQTFGYIYCYDAFYEAIIRWLFEKTGAIIPSEQIVLNHGVVPTIAAIVQSFCEKGDRVLINTPVYGPFTAVPKLNDCELICNPLKIVDNRYYLDFHLLEQQLQETHPRLLIFCSPLNPSGRIWTREELTNVAGLCRKYNTLLIIDEVHSDHIYQGEFFSALSLEESDRQHIIALHSPNKGFNFAGLKTSYSIIPNPQLRRQLQLQMEKNWMTEPNVYGIAALIAAYSPEGKQWLQESYQYIIENYQWSQTFLEKNCPSLNYMPMESSYLLWLNISATNMTDVEFVEKLAKATGVILQEGSSFGENGQDFVRMNLATSRENVQRAWEKIASWLEEQVR